MRHLSDPNFYKPLVSDPKEAHNKVINDLIDGFSKSGDISGDDLDVLTTPKARTPELYLVPKTHKKLRPTRETHSVCDLAIYQYPE